MPRSTVGRGTAHPAAVRVASPPLYVPEPEGEEDDPERQRLAA